MNYASFNNLDSEMMPIPDSLLSNELMYNDFSTIKPNSDLKLTELQIEKFDKEYCLTIVKESINIFKSKIESLYLSKIQINSDLSKAVNEYTVFRDTIDNTIDILDSNTDNLLIDVLNNLIKEKYFKLNIEVLSAKNEAISLEENYIKKTLKEFTSIINPTTCNICYENQVTHFINPCGHTICNECKIKIAHRNTSCHICRNKINNYFKLYF